MSEQASHPTPPPGERMYARAKERAEKRLGGRRVLRAGAALSTLLLAGALVHQNLSGGGSGDSDEREKDKIELVEDSVEVQTQDAITDLAADIMKIKENAHANNSSNYGVNIETDTGVYGLSVTFPLGYEGDYDPKDAEGIHVNVSEKDPNAPGGYRDVSRIIFGKLINEDPANQEDVYLMEVGFLADEGFVVARFTTGEYPTYNDNGDLIPAHVEAYKRTAGEIVGNASQAAAAQGLMKAA